MSSNKDFHCSNCSAIQQKSGRTHCWNNDPQSNAPRYCPESEHQIINKSFSHYRENSDDDNESSDAKIARVAARVEGLCYRKEPGSSVMTARWTRVEDTIAFAKLMGYQTIGIATCLGLLTETHQLVTILKVQGFNPLSVCCKAGKIDKSELNISEQDKIYPDKFEPACNPIAQAELLNAANTDMNIIVGLCVGHDMLFSKYSHAPVTTLVVKDRVTGHNPVSVLYGQNTYYKRLQTQTMVIDPIE